MVRRGAQRALGVVQRAAAAQHGRDEDEQAYKARKEAEEAGRRASKAQAKECVEAWWQACPRQSQFSVECAARLTRAGTTSLYNNLTGPLKGLGLGFERPLTKDDSLETVQGLLKYVALERVGLPGHLDRDPATLSGGQAARVALARTLLADPEALLLDEPFSRLDTDLRQTVRQLVFDLVAERQIPALLVTHDRADAEAAGGPIVDLGAGATS